MTVSTRAVPHSPAWIIKGITPVLEEETMCIYIQKNTNMPRLPLQHHLNLGVFLGKLGLVCFIISIISPILCSHTSRRLFLLLSHTCGIAVWGFGLWVRSEISSSALMTKCFISPKLSRACSEGLEMELTWACQDGKSALSKNRNCWSWEISTWWPRSVWPKQI